MGHEKRTGKTTGGRRIERAQGDSRGTCRGQEGGREKEEVGDEGERGMREGTRERRGGEWKPGSLGRGA